MRRGRLAAGGRPRQHAHLRGFVMRHNVARNVFNVLVIGILHLIDHDLRVQKRRVVNLL